MRSVCIIFLCFVTFISTVLCSHFLEEGDEFATIVFFIGDVKKNDVQVNIGDVLKETDIIITGANSFCDIRLGMSMIRVKENSKLQLSHLRQKENEENVLLKLDIGKILCKPKELLKNESFVVQTPTIVAGVRGTLFYVEADKDETTQVKVFKGKVKVARRFVLLEEKFNVERILDNGSTLEQNEQAIVTSGEIKTALAKIEKEIESLTKKGEVDEESLMRITRPLISIEKSNVQKFSLEGMPNEREEFVSVVRKSPELIKQIRKAIRREKEEPMPDGSLLITRHEFYFIKNGRVERGWKVIGEPVRWQDRVYIASKDYVFCASLEGPVRWRRKIQNDGKIEIKDNSVIVNTTSGIKKLDLNTGAIIE